MHFELYLCQFIGLVSTEENNLKPKSSLSALPIDYTAALFIETASWAMVCVGTIYFLSGLLCGQRYINRVRDDHTQRLAERKKCSRKACRATRHCPDR